MRQIDSEEYFPIYGNDGAEHMPYMYGTDWGESVTGDMEEFFGVVRNVYGDDLTRLPEREQEKIRFYAQLVAGLAETRDRIRDRIDQDVHYYRNACQGRDDDFARKCAEEEDRCDNRLWMVGQTGRTALDRIYSDMAKGTLPYDADSQKGAMSAVDAAVQKYWDSAQSEVARAGRRKRDALDVMEEAGARGKKEFSPWPSSNMEEPEYDWRGFMRVAHKIYPETLKEEKYREEEEEYEPWWGMGGAE